MSFTNTTLAKLRRGEATSCVWLSLGAVALAEIAAEQAPDAVVLDGQHGLWDVVSTHAACAVIAPHATPLVRVAANTGHAIGSALDAGAQGVIVPLVDDAAQAAAAVDAARYPPHGNRSGGGFRPLRDFPAYVAACATETLVSVMIETRAGLDNAAAIAAVPGLDLIFIGPGDLGLALGDAAALEPAIATILAAARAAGVPCGIFTGDADAARRRIAQGFAFVVAAEDIGINRRGIATGLTGTHA